MHISVEVGKPIVWQTYTCDPLLCAVYTYRHIISRHVHEGVINKGLHLRSHARKMAFCISINDVC